MDQRRHRFSRALSPLLPLAGLTIGAVVVWAERHLCTATGWWAAPLVVLGATVWAWALHRLDTLLPQPGGLAFLHCCAAASVYACVPETDQMKGVGLLVLGVGLLELVGSERLPIGWHLVVAGTITWAGVYGSSGRGSALVGATFAGWPVLLPALVGATAAACFLGVAGTWLESRTGAIQQRTSPAVVGIGLWAATTLALALLVRLRVGRPRH